MLAALPRAAAGRHEHAARRRAVRPGPRVRADAPARARGSGRLRPRTSTSRTSRARASNRKLPVRVRRRAARACSTSWTSSRRPASPTTSSSSTTSRSSASAPASCSASAAPPPRASSSTRSTSRSSTRWRTRLVFERFLHVDRKEPPDVDFDIPDDRRDEVIRYVAEKYGYDRVAQIITFGTMGAKAAIRDIGRALGMSYGDVDRVARLVPNALHMTLEKALEEAPELAAAYEIDPQVSGPRRYRAPPRGRRAPRQHARGRRRHLAASRWPTSCRCSARRAATSRRSRRRSSRWQQVAEIGLLKMDFLGLANLTILGRAVEIIERTRGVRIDLTALPDGDPKTFEMLEPRRHLRRVPA